MSDVIEVGIGTEFRSVIADGNALWRVTGKAGPNVWHAEVQPEWAEIRGERMMVSDYAGSTDVFTTERIAGSLHMSDVFARHASEADEFWEAQEIGTVLHYHDGFGKYVRGRVAYVVTDGEGRNELVPTDLVGKWDDRDLVSWNAWGEINEGYHVRKIKDENSWQPSPTCVYEHPRFSGPRGRFAGEDPRELEPLSLEPPTRGPNEIAWHEAIALRNSISKVLSDSHPQTADEVYAVLDEIKGMLP